NFITDHTKDVTDGAEKSEKLTQLKKAVLLSIKTIQENINHGGISYFNNANYYGEITDRDAQALCKALIGGEEVNKKDLELICRHENVYGINKDIKWSYWKTNYTNSANELRNFIHAHCDQLTNTPNTSKNEPDIEDFFAVNGDTTDFPEAQIPNNGELIRLAMPEVNTIIQAVLNKFFGLTRNIDLWGTWIQASSNKKLFVEPMVEGKVKLSNKLKNIEERKEDTVNSLTLIPYQITNRSLGRENHAVLVVVYNKKKYLIDPKEKIFIHLDSHGKNFDHQHGLGWQAAFDNTNCGYYTAELARRLGQKFMEDNDNGFSMEDFLKDQKQEKPDIKQFAPEFKEISNQLCPRV
ncbi:MAG: hypothetical protein ACK4M7_09940, partial [Burkholderiales bacterium]